VTDDWYRTPNWSKDDRSDFEKRLKQARPHSRPQYLRIKAIALREHGGRLQRAAARELNERVLREHPDAVVDVAVAREELARLAEEDGLTEHAIELWRAAVSLPAAGAPTGDAYLRLPELLIQSDDPQRWKEAASVIALITPERDLLFSSQRFRYAVLCARLANRNRDRDSAARFAEDALVEANRTRPDLGRHPDLGWVHADAATVSEMERLARRR
jgi:hypothetical protein